MYCLCEEGSLPLQTIFFPSDLSGVLSVVTMNRIISLIEYVDVDFKYFEWSCERRMFLFCVETYELVHSVHSLPICISSFSYFDFFLTLEVFWVLAFSLAIVLKLFLIFGQSEPQCSYKVCSYKKACLLVKAIFQIPSRQLPAPLALHISEVEI